MLFLPPRVTDRLAERIERAYRLHRPGPIRDWTDSSVWTVAAGTLLELHRGDPNLPLDPELFVACQAAGLPIADPWEELTGNTSATCYRQRVRKLVLGLRRELRNEVRQAEARIARGATIGTIVSLRNRSLSPLGRLIVAHRAGRPDLVRRLRAAARDQHRACPLYRQACAGMLPPAVYPGQELPTDFDTHKSAGCRAPAVCLN